MALHRYVNPSDSTGDLVVDGPTIAIIGHVVFEAPKAASLLSALRPELRMGAIEDFLEHGAATAAAVQTSAHIVLLENKIEELVTKLAEALAEQLKTADRNSAEETEKLLTAFNASLTRLLGPLDPNTKDGLPTVMVAMLEKSNKAAMDHIAVMLNDAEEGALGKAVKKITGEVKEMTTAITKVIGEREALRTKSNRRGGCFEEVLSIRLPILTRGMGRVEHCARAEGDKAADAGDYLITVESVPGGEFRQHRRRGQEPQEALQRQRHQGGAQAGAVQPQRGGGRFRCGEGRTHCRTASASARYRSATFSSPSTQRTAMRRRSSARCTWRRSWRLALSPTTVVRRSISSPHNGRSQSSADCSSSSRRSRTATARSTRRSRRPGRWQPT